MNQRQQELTNRCLFWGAHSHGLNIRPVVSWDQIENPVIRLTLECEERMTHNVPSSFQGYERRFWLDREKDTLYVFIDNIRDEASIDAIILRQVVAHKGLAGILGAANCEQMGEIVFNNLYPPVQDNYLSQFSGDRNNRGDRSSAGRRFVVSCANKVITSDNPTKAMNNWIFQVERRIKSFDNELWKHVYLDKGHVARIIGSALREYQFNLDKQKKISLSQPVEDVVKDAVLRLHNKELDGHYIDRGKYIDLGFPSDIVTTCAPWAKPYPFELPYSAIFGRAEDFNNNRFAKTTEEVKKDKHPYSILSLGNIKKDIDAPLAIFKSRDHSSRESLVFMLPTIAGVADAVRGNLCVPVSPKEVAWDERQGRVERRESGQWVNRIDSIYPKQDIQYLAWLSIRGLQLYIDPQFESKWLRPAVERIEREFKEKFSSIGESMPTANEIEEFKRNTPAYSTEWAQKNIARAQEVILDRAGLLSGYVIFKSLEESATKVVRNFENAIADDKKINRATLKCKNEKGFNKFIKNLRDGSGKEQSIGSKSPKG